MLPTRKKVHVHVSDCLLIVIMMNIQYVLIVHVYQYVSNVFHITFPLITYGKDQTVGYDIFQYVIVNLANTTRYYFGLKISIFKTR